MKRCTSLVTIPGWPLPLDPLLGLELLELFQTLRPVFSQQARERAVREELSAGLAARAVVRLVLGVGDPLNGSRAHGTGLPVPAVDRHFRPERRYLLRELVAGFRAQLIGPLDQGLPRRAVKPFGLLVGKPGSPGDGGKPSAMEDLVGVGVSDSAEEPRIGERALQRVVLSGEGAPELLEIGFEDFETSAVEKREVGLPAHQVERSSSLGAGFGGG